MNGSPPAADPAELAQTSGTCTRSLPDLAWHRTTRRGRDHPDLIVLDVNLPDMTGFEVVERLRRSPEFASIPVLHLSASFTSNADRARGLEQGADAFLTHPIDPAVFVATARALIRASTADRRTREAMREWQATFDALPDAVMLLDQEGVVTRANRAAMTLLGGDDRAVVCAPQRARVALRRITPRDGGRDQWTATSRSRAARARGARSCCGCPGQDRAAYPGARSTAPGPGALYFSHASHPL